MEKLLWITLVIVMDMMVGVVMGVDLLTQETVDRRKLTRFKVGHPDNQMCWERHGVDGFYSPVDAHNHFRPFSGPPVPWDTYIGWMKDHGIMFSTMLGIGQQMMPKNPGDPACCYYLHCATYDYPVTPDQKNDIDNANDFNNLYKGQALADEMHLTLSFTSPNLQQPENNSRILGSLEDKFRGDFKWAGEINVYKHALAANGFFENGDRVTEEYIRSGRLDSLFQQLEDKKWPTTLHCDLGCDNYDSVPAKEGCFVPESELRLAKQNYRWWKSFLGPHFRAFFDGSNTPKKNFKKIQHLKIWDTLLNKYPNMIVVWAHLGLSKELKYLHPSVHAFIIDKLLTSHPNLYADASWDVLSKQLLMNYKGANVSLLHHTIHEDLDRELAGSLVDTEQVEEMRQELETTWAIHREMVVNTGSVTGPTHAMAIYLEMFHKHPDRFITGTDFVNSLGPPADFPGLKEKPNGCMKDKANHARQVTDTSAINMFFGDEAFRKIVLGENYFNILNISHLFQPPPVCGDTILPVETIIGIGVGAALLIVLLVVIIVVVVLCRKSKDDRSSFIRVDSGGNAATTHV